MLASVTARPEIGLEVRGLTREPWFRAKDLAIAAGEIVVLRGATGSGKTLFLRAIADLDPCDAGTARVHGVERVDLSSAAWRARVIYVHPEPPRYPGTVRADLARFAALAAAHGRGTPGAADAPWGLPADGRTEDLSSGEGQLLGLHRALRAAPDALLLDEATRSLDPDTARRAERAVLDFAAAGGAVLWVAHDDGLAARLGSREERFP
jgi:putative ABC transport system ATP-binding protein